MFRLILFSAFLSRASILVASPDVLLILVDDLRPMLGCYGDARIHTPNIDRLARKGIVFERAYCQYAKCGTSRLSLLSGLRPNAVGVYSNNVQDVVRFRKRRPDAVTLPRWLRSHGYHTQSYGKIYHDGWDDPQDWSAPAYPGRSREMWEIVDEKNPDGPTLLAERLDCPVLQKPNVDDAHLFAGRMTDRVLREIVSFQGNSPRFLAVGYRRPHLPFVAPRRYFDLYAPDKSWLAKNTQPPAGSPVMAWFNSDGYIGSAKRVGLSMPTRPGRQQAVAWNGYELRSYNGVPNQGPIPEKTRLELLHAYAACVSYVDAQIGRLLAGLNQSPRGEKTIVLLASDHGWHLGEHSAWSKMTNYEVATRVPLIISVPEGTPGRTREIAELVDLYPTICRLTGTPAPPHLEGEDLSSTLTAPETVSPDSTALSQYSRFRDRFMGMALRTSRFRFVRWVDQESGKVVHRELFDHDEDPAETRNLAGSVENSEVVAELENRLVQLTK